MTLYPAAVANERMAAGFSKAKNSMITDAQIANRLGMSRQKVRYHRTRPESTKSRRCDTELAIERAKEELTQELIEALTNGKNKRTGRPNKAAAANPV